MTFAEFHNGLRVLMNIDADEFHNALYPELGGDPRKVSAEQWNEWGLFRSQPHHWFIRASDDQAQAIWKIIEERTPR